MKRRQQSIGMTTAAATKSKSAAEEGIFVRPESSSEEDNGRESKNEFIASVFFENSASSLVPPPRKKISKEGGGGDGGDSSDISTTPNNHQRSPTAIVSTETEIPFPEPVIRMSTEPTTTTASVAAAAAAGFNQGYYHHKRHVSEGTYHHHHYHETTKVPELRHNRTNSEDVSSLFSSRQQQQRGGGGGGMLLIPSLQPPSRRNVSLEGNKQKSQPQILVQQHQQQESSSEEEVFPPVPPVRPPLRPPTSLLDTTTSPSTRLSSSAIQPPKRKSSSSGSTSSNEEQQQQVLLNHKDSVNSEYSEQSLPLSKLVVITDHNTTTNMIKRSTNTNTMTSSSSSVGIDANVNNDNTTITTTTTTTNEESFGSSQAIDISKHENSFTGKDNEYSVTSPQYHHHSEGGGGEGEGKGGGKQQQQQQQHHPQRLSSSDVMIAASIQHNPIIARLNDNNTTTKTQKFDVNLFPKSLVMEQQQQDIHLEEPERIISIEQQKQKGGGEGSSSGGGKKNNNHVAVSSSTSPLLSPVIIPPEASSTSVTLSPREVVLPQGSSPPPPVTAAVGTPTTRRKQQPGGLRESSPLSSSWAAVPPSSSTSPTLLLRTPTQGIRPNQIPPSLVMTQSTTIEPELTYSYSSPIIIIPTDEKTQYRNEPPLPIRRSPPSPTKIIHMTGSIDYSSDEHEVLNINGDGDDDGIKATGYDSQTIIIKKNKDVQKQEYIKGGNFRQIRREAKERQRRISHSDGSDKKTNKQERHPSSSVYPQQQHYEKGGNFRQIRKEVTSASPPRDRMNRTTTTGDQSEDDTALRRPTSSASPQDVKGGNFRRVQNDVKKKGQQRQNSGQSLSPHHQDRKSDNMNATAANHSGSPVGVKQSYTRQQQQQQQQQQGKHLGGGNDVVDEKKSYPLASGNVNRREQGNSRASDPTRATSRVSGKSIVDQDKPPNRQTSGPEVGEFSISQPTRHMYSAAKDKYTDNRNDKSHTWSISCPEVDESSRPKTIREINRERKERQKLSDLGEVSAVDLPNSHARTSGNSRERQIVQNEPDQQKNRYVRPPTSTAAVESTNAARIANRERRERNKMSDLGDGGAYDISPSQPRDITANKQEPEWNSRSIPRKEDASEEPIRSGSHTMVSSLPNFVSQTSTTMGPAVYSPEAHVRNHSGLMKAGASDRGDSQPLNFRAQRQLTDNSSEEYSACSDDENEDLVPGAFNVTTRGIEYRQNKGILTESQRFSSIATNSRASEGDSLAYSAKSGSSTAYSSKTSSFQQERRSTRNAPPTTNDVEAPALSATLQPSTADAPVVDPDDGKKWFLRQPFLAGLCICLVIVLAIAIAVPLVLSQNPSTPPPNSTPPATMAPSGVPSTAPTGLSVRAYEFIDIVQSVSAESDLTDPSQPQFKAVTWLADKDERNLYPSRETEEEKEIIERYIMALLYFAWNPQFTFSGFLSAAGYCGWNDSSEKGIFCKDSHISQIQLSGQGLDGAIPTEVFSLQYLDTLDLSDNFLTATIPSEIRFCTNLRDVNMGKQKKIPRLEGTIPSEIFSLPFLENLNLGTNSLNGTIPSAISNATRLRSFNIDVNKMSGTLPSGLGNLSNLEVLSLAVNKLNGSIPSDFFRMTNLVTLSMQDNPVTGTIQSEFGLFSNLRNLTLANTHLSGVLPSELGMLSTLEELNLRRVFVQDAIPTTLLELSSLRTLILDGTSLSDEAGVVESLCNTNLPSPGEFSVGSTGIQCDCCGDP